MSRPSTPAPPHPAPEAQKHNLNLIMVEALIMLVQAHEAAYSAATYRALHRRGLVALVDSGTPIATKAGEQLVASLAEVVHDDDSEEPTTQAELDLDTHLDTEPTDAEYMAMAGQDVPEQAMAEQAELDQPMGSDNPLDDDQQPATQPEDPDDQQPATQPDGPPLPPGLRHHWRNWSAGQSPMVDDLAPDPAGGQPSTAPYLSALATFLIVPTRATGGTELDGPVLAVVVGTREQAQGLANTWNLERIAHIAESPQATFAGVAETSIPVHVFDIEPAND